ncbi:T9SS type A sorting domain-containing protein [Desertivirga arenae]|uniref:T9SS type A sorting domain-containing protein n=1 Tax=Desertivirga arenae TaxID=2810309 RepID=UPI001A97CE8C|nr:T9SS type A sorting domain-containing protein [Pedobacter sp. SYSU D00823]
MSLLKDSRCLLLLCLVSVFTSLRTLASVIITPATGGIGLSADKSAGSSADSYTTIGDIIISSGATGDFALSQSNKDFVLTAPANWQFKAGTGNVIISGPTLTSATIAVTATTITVTFSTGSVSSASNSITISGIQVKASVKTTLSTNNIIRTSGSANIIGWGYAANCGSLSQVPGNFVKLQLLLPGETSTPGTSTGKTGTPTPWTAGGTVTTVIVNAVDENWNRVTTITDVIAMAGTDPNATWPANTALSGGTRSFSVTLRTPGTQTITASNVTSSAIPSSTSPSFTVNVGAFSKLQLLLPGEIAAPGTSTGKTGTPTARTAGSSFTVTVNAVDAVFNIVSSVTDQVRVTSSDPNAVLPSNAALNSGTGTFTITLRTAGARTISATDVTDGAKQGNTSPNTTVNTGTFTKLQILLPGETAAPGTVSGKTGSATACSAGSAIAVVVNAVDDCWNRVSTITDNVGLTCTDANATIPAAAALATGNRTFYNLTLRKVGTTTITATNLSNNSITPAVSGPATVNVGPFYALQLLLPGETANPGTSAGKTGSPTGITAGAPVNIIVNAVDRAYNIVSSATDIVKIASSDVNAVLPANAALNSGTSSLQVTLRTAGSWWISASDVTNASRGGSRSPNATVSPGVVTRLQIILPGETAAPGTNEGKKGVATANPAGSGFYLRVNAVDACFNRVTTVTDVVNLAITDATATTPANAALAGGTKSDFIITPRTLGSQTITATDVTNGSILSTTATFTVKTGSFTKLQLLMPGETAAPGTSTGKTGTPIAQTAGSSFSITVNAVDAAYNIVSTVSDVIKFGSSDTYAVLPANSALSSGTKSFPVTLRTAGSRWVAVSDVTDGRKGGSQSPNINLNTGSFSALQLLLPGETAAPGSATGKIGNQNPPARNSPFQITINAVDNCFNRIASATNTITLTSSDALASLQAPGALTSGTRNFAVTLKTAGTQTITASGGPSPVTVSVLDNVSPSNAGDYFRSVASGNWIDAASWQSSANGSTNWHAATLVPGTLASGITILEGNIITVNSNITVDQVSIQSGGQVNIASGVTLTIADGPGTGDFEVSGILNNAGAITTTGTLLIGSTGKYQHAWTSNPGTIPTAIWATESTCEIMGYTSATGTITNANQSYYNLIWNCPGQNISANGVSMGGTFSTVSLTVSSTGSGNMQLGNTGGNVVVTGDFIQTGGTLVMNNSSAALDMNLEGSFIMTGGTFQRGNGTGRLNFSGATVLQNFVKTGGAFSGAVQFAVNPGARVDFGTSILDAGSSSFILNAGATLYTANPAGIAASGSSGSVQTSTRTFSTAANYVYNGNDIQVTGSGLPLTVNNLTIDNPLTVSFPATNATYTIAGALDVKDGILDLKMNNLAAGAGFTNSGNGAIYTQSVGSLPLPSTRSWSSAIYYNGAGTQTIVPGIYTDIYLSEPGMKVGGSGTLYVSGNWTSTDADIDFSQNNTAVVFNGTNQLVNDASLNGITFKNLSFSNSGTKKLESGSFTVINGGVLSVTGSAVLDANGNLNLACDNVGHASVAPLTGSADIIGNVNVKVFLTGNNASNYRGTRGISSPVNDTHLSKKTFQQLKDYILITGPGNTSNGFDLGGTNAPNAVTLQTYYEPGYANSTSYIPMPDIYQSATPGKGYLVFFRGDRSDDINKFNSISAPSPEDVTVVFTGPLNKGTISAPLTNSHLLKPAYPHDDPNNGLNLVGNPYASAIDWKSVFAASTNLEDQIKVIKPGGGVATYMNGVPNNAPSSGSMQYIQPGQAFYVKVKDSENTGTINFTENCKVNGINPPRLLSVPEKGLRLLASATKPTIVSTVSPTLIRLAISDDVSEDEATLAITPGASFTGEDDAAYMLGSTVSLASLSSDGKNQAINFMPPPLENTTVKLFVSATESKSAVISFKSLPQSLSVKLKDNYLDKTVSAETPGGYTFTIDKDVAATYGNSRFELIVGPPVVLALSIRDLKLKKTDQGAKLDWRITENKNLTYFEIERSAEGKMFESRGRVVIGDNTQLNFSFIDSSPLFGRSYYRICVHTSDGERIYSDVKTLDFSRLASNSLNVYPNPSTDKTYVEFESPESPAVLRIFSLAGQKLMERKVNAGESRLGIDLSGIVPGTYIIELKQSTNTNSVQRAKLIKE